MKTVPLEMEIVSALKKNKSNFKEEINKSVHETSYYRNPEENIDISNALVVERKPQGPII